jgi:DNA-binding response OmpR family regulator
MIGSEPHRQRVLVADDERHITRLLQCVLEQQGYEVTVVHDGREALMALQREDYDRVVLDLMMPYLDGYEVLRWIREHPTKWQTWVALMTAQAEAMRQDMDMPYRADLYVEKPVDINNLFPMP